MRALALRIWELPWPPALRRLVEPVLLANAFQLFFVPHFKAGVIGLFLDEEGKILLFRHTYRNDFPWGVPSGFMEHGEQPAAALRREVEEEAGFRIHISGLRHIYADRRHILNIVYTGTVVGGTFIPSEEISEARFFPPQNLPPLLPDQQHLIRAYIEEKQHDSTA